MEINNLSWYSSVNIYAFDCVNSEMYEIIMCGWTDIPKKASSILFTVEMTLADLHKTQGTMNDIM